MHVLKLLIQEHGRGFEGSLSYSQSNSRSIEVPYLKITTIKIKQLWGPREAAKLIKCFLHKREFRSPAPTQNIRHGCNSIVRKTEAGGFQGLASYPSWPKWKTSASMRDPKQKVERG